MKEKKFIDAYLLGESSVLDIEDYINKFKIMENNTEIYDYLGLTKVEYDTWKAQGTVAIENILLKFRTLKKEAL